MRFVIDLLNAVCAQHWHASYEPLPDALRGTPRSSEDPPMLYVRCTLSLFGVERSDVGEGRDGTSNGAGPKAAHSDALKRAAVHFGVNQALYYVASHHSDAVVMFDRAPNGTLAQKPGTAGCVREVAPANSCVDGTALAGPSSVAVSPDGQNAYIAAGSSDAVAVFDREPNPPPTPDTTTPVLSGLDPAPTP